MPSIFWAILIRKHRHANKGKWPANIIHRHKCVKVSTTIKGDILPTVLIYAIVWTNRVPAVILHVPRARATSADHSAVYNVNGHTNRLNMMAKIWLWSINMPICSQSEKLYHSKWLNCFMLELETAFRSDYDFIGATNIYYYIGIEYILNCGRNCVFYI